MSDHEPWHPAAWSDERPGRAGGRKWSDAGYLLREARHGYVYRLWSGTTVICAGQAVNLRARMGAAASVVLTMVLAWNQFDQDSTELGWRVAMALWLENRDSGPGLIAWQDPVRR